MMASCSDGGENPLRCREMFAQTISVMFVVIRAVMSTPITVTEFHKGAEFH